MPGDPSEGAAPAFVEAVLGIWFFAFLGGERAPDKPALRRGPRAGVLGDRVREDQEYAFLLLRVEVPRLLAPS